MFKEKLKELRTSNEYSMDALAELYNNKFDGKLNKSTISRYENGLQQPMYTVVRNFAALFDVSVDYLSNDDERSIFDFPGIMPIETKKIPLLGEIACGEPIYATEDFESYVECGADVKADFALRAKGDSMINARINDGDIVFIRKQDTVNQGEIAAVLIGDDATLKRFRQYGNHIVLQAENPMFDDIEFDIGEDVNVRILGKAVAFQSDII